MERRVTNRRALLCSEDWQRWNRSSRTAVLKAYFDADMMWDGLLSAVETLGGVE